MPAPRGKSHATKLINLVLSCGAELFYSPAGDPYVTVPTGDHHETFSLTGRTMKEWLAREFFIATRSGVPGGALADALTALSGHARARGVIRPIYVRVAAIGDTVYLDLGRSDFAVMLMSADGWRVIPMPADVRFLRRRGLRELPIPMRSEKQIEVLLAWVIHIDADSPDMKLLIGWLVGALRGRKPYPVLVIGGEYGATKTYACQLARRLIDPSDADLSAPPKDPRDLMICAQNSHVIGFDNLSFIPDWLSDALCRLATESGLRIRALYTDQDEVIFKAGRPVILNGITDMIRRGDLVDRSISILIDPMTEEQRRTEAEIDARFLEVQPGILAALADAVCQALRAPVTLMRLPRMADFARTVESAAPALEWKAGAFLDAYAERRAETIDILLDNDLVAVALERLLRDLCTSDADGVATWTGTSEDLREQITSLTPEHKREKLPKSDKGVIGALRRLAPALRGKGINVQLPKKQETSGERRGRRLITITRTATPEAASAPAEAEPVPEPEPPDLLAELQAIYDERRE